ncbi:E3 ubiquitin-protein ligase RNF4 [Holothuria leucospilota]|uniref:E3 ubiquitin-protein ligase RNF4 n=1 Tax=Holothuria leucospilota TaxID=206669 RepID=A0A9Q0YSQ2_HOLLE|nr:E3 ubiquitin-protein ligase RNF4 [Holothuria leucospilota]
MIDDEKMERDRARRKRTNRGSSEEVVDLSFNPGRRGTNEPIVEEEIVAVNEASTSVAIVDLTKDSNDSSILSADVVDLTEINGTEDRDEVTPPKRSRRRKHTSQDMGSGNSVVISSGDETDDSDDLVLLNSPLPDEVNERLASCKTASPPKKIIKCPICYDDDAAIKASGRRLVSTNCGHIFCENCLKTSISTQHKCPTCRKKLTMRQMHPIFL